MPQHPSPHNIGPNKKKKDMPNKIKQPKFTPLAPNLEDLTGTQNHPTPCDPWNPLPSAHEWHRTAARVALAALTVLAALAVLAALSAMVGHVSEEPNGWVMRQGGSRGQVRPWASQRPVLRAWIVRSAGLFPTEKEIKRGALEEPMCSAPLTHPIIQGTTRPKAGAPTFCKMKGQAIHAGLCQQASLLPSLFLSCSTAQGGRGGKAVWHSTKL